MQVEPEGGPTLSAGVVVIMEGIAGGLVVLVLIQGRRFRYDRRALAYARQRFYWAGSYTVIF